jgi:hypothetical protein
MFYDDEKDLDVVVKNYKLIKSWIAYFNILVRDYLISKILILISTRRSNDLELSMPLHIKMLSINTLSGIILKRLGQMNI